MGFLYLIKNLDVPNRYKIGITTDLKSRLQALMSSSGCDLEFIHTSKEVSNYREHELNLHRKYKDFRYKGEWFNLNDFQITEVINYLDNCESIEPLVGEVIAYPFKKKIRSYDCILYSWVILCNYIAEKIDNSINADLITGMYVTKSALELLEHKNLINYYNNVDVYKEQILLSRKSLKSKIESINKLDLPYPNSLNNLLNIEGNHLFNYSKILNPIQIDYLSSKHTDIDFSEIPSVFFINMQFMPSNNILAYLKKSCS